MGDENRGDDAIECSDEHDNRSSKSNFGVEHRSSCVLWCAFTAVDGRAKHANAENDRYDDGERGDDVQEDLESQREALEGRGLVQQGGRLVHVTCLGLS